MYKKNIIRNLIVIFIGVLLFFSAIRTTDGNRRANITIQEIEAAKLQEENARLEAERKAIEEQESLAREAAKSKDFTIVMVGDILLHDPLIKNYKVGDTYDFSPMFWHTKDTIQSADLAIANQEVIIGGENLRVTGYPTFNAPFELADALVSAGFDVICHGTNHALDRGGIGIKNCLNNWREKYPDIRVLGIHDSEPVNLDNNIMTITNCDGVEMTVAVLNYTYGTNGIALPNDMPWAVDMLKEETVISQIKELKSKADFIIVAPHWGTEYRLTPDSYQEKWTKIFLENGVDLVLGTHPHVCEPIEFIEDENGNKMLIYYSIGNFINWTGGVGAGVANRMLGGMAKVKITKNEEGCFITDYEVESLISHVVSSPGECTVYPLSEYTPELASSNEIRNNDANFSYEYITNLANDIFKDKWR